MPSRRNQGIGTALLRHALDNIRRDDLRFVELGTGGDEFHAPARRLYEAFGFHPIPMTGYLRRL
ncbi:MAG: GNAT family N-acetyltransferase [Nakamurella sp.]